MSELTEDIENTNTATSTGRPPLTPEQREKKNLRDRERRAAAKAAAGNTAQNASQSGRSDVPLEGSSGQQQTQRDQQFQSALSESLKIRDRARAIQVRESQRRQVERRVESNSTHK